MGSYWPYAGKRSWLLSALEGVAGYFTGGTFFLCDDRREAPPVLYASSEGQAGLIGQSLAEALEIMVGLPS